MASIDKEQLSEILTDDVLLTIFDYLDEDDLQLCEAVCSKWRRLIFTGATLQRLYHWKIKRSITWQKCSAAVGTEGEFSHEIYRQIYNQVQGLYKNWQTGSFKKTMYRLERDVFPFPPIIMNKSYLIKRRSCNTVKILNRKTMLVEFPEIETSISSVLENACRIYDNVLVINLYVSIEFFEAATGLWLNGIVEQNGFNIKAIGYGPRGLIAAVTKNDEDICLNIWRMNDTHSIVHLKQLPLDSLDYWSIKIVMDEHRMAISMLFKVCRDGSNLKKRRIWKISDTSDTKDYCPGSIKECRTFYFISTDTLEIERSLTVFEDIGRYSQGSLILLNSRNCVRLVDISTGQSSEMTGLGPFDWNMTRCRANPRYLVMTQPIYSDGNSSQRSVTSKFGVFDLLALKSNKCKGLLAYFEVPFNTEDFQVDDTQIVCIGHPVNEEAIWIMVLDFMPKR